MSVPLNAKLANFCDFWHVFHSFLVFFQVFKTSSFSLTVYNAHAWNATNERGNVLCCTWKHGHREVGMKFSERQWQMQLRPWGRSDEQLIACATPHLSVGRSHNRSAARHKVVHEESFVEQMQQMNCNVMHCSRRAAHVQQSHVQHRHLVARIFPSTQHAHYIHMWTDKKTQNKLTYIVPTQPSIHSGSVNE